MMKVSPGPLVRFAGAGAVLLTLHCGGSVSAGNGAQGGGGADGGAVDEAAPGPDGTVPGTSPDASVPQAADGSAPGTDAPTSAPDAQNRNDGSGSGDGCAPAGRAGNHRALAVVCPATPLDAGYSADGGSTDQCLSDTDCGDAGVCSCRGSTFAWAHVSAGNSCVRSNCRVDSDCGPGGVCSPTVDPSCGPFYGIVGYYCRTCADRCENDSDCPGNVEAGTPSGYCAYDSTVGYWACGYGFCAG
jgi:hypothetical protein